MAKKYKRYVNRATDSGPGAPSRVEFNPDYSAVKKDLKRIGTLAGFFILVLIALSFYLR